MKHHYGLFFTLCLLFSKPILGQSFYEYDTSSYKREIYQDFDRIEKELTKYDTVYFLATHTYPKVNYRLVLKNKQSFNLADIERGKKLKSKRYRSTSPNFSFSIDDSKAFYNYLNFNDSIQPNSLTIKSHGYTVIIGKYVVEQKELDITILNGSISSIREIENPSNDAQSQFREVYLNFQMYFDNLLSISPD